MHSRFPSAPAALGTCLTVVALSCSSSAPAPADAGLTAVDSGCPSPLVGLVIKNIEGGCSVTVNGDVSLGGSGMTTICQMPATVTLAATPNTGFMLGSQPWHDAATESGGSASVTLTSGTTCVWVCCPGATGPSACPTEDQCL